MTLPGLYTGMPMVGSGATSCNINSYWMMSMLVIFGLVRMISPAPPLLRIRSFSQVFQQRLGRLEVDGVKPRGEPAVYRCEQVIGCSALALVLPEAAQARGGAEFPRRGLFPVGHGEGLLETGCRNFSQLLQDCGPCSTLCFSHRARVAPVHAVVFQEYIM